MLESVRPVNNKHTEGVFRKRKCFVILLWRNMGRFPQWNASPGTVGMRQVKW